jgi:hypothetical protein
MPSDGDDLPVEIARDADGLFAAMRTVGWTVVRFSYDAAVMGNWQVGLLRGGHSLQIVRDKSQFFIEGPPAEELKAAGLWRAFDDSTKFCDAVAHWALNKPQV